MTRTREENAADLAHEEGQRETIREWLGTWRGGYVRRHIEAGHDDEDALVEALENDPMMKEGGAADFCFEDVAREALIHHREIAQRIAGQIDAVFGEPDLITGDGNRWFRIDTAEKVDLARLLGQTAIREFWEWTRPDVQSGDSHEWMIMLNDRNVAQVTMAAKKTGTESCHGNKLADCHVTGFRNKPAFLEHEEDIRAACAVLGLECFPNHMGEPLPERDSDAPEAFPTIPAPGGP